MQISSVPLRGECSIGSQLSCVKGSKWLFAAPMENGLLPIESSAVRSVPGPSGTALRRTDGRCAASRRSPSAAGRYSSLARAGASPDPIVPPGRQDRRHGSRVPSVLRRDAGRSRVDPSDRHALPRGVRLRYARCRRGRGPAHQPGRPAPGCMFCRPMPTCRIPSRGTRGRCPLPRSCGGRDLPTRAPAPPARAHPTMLTRS